MAVKVYEGMFLLNSNRYAKNPGGVAARIPEMIERCGGEMLASRLWNEQRLAYPINGQRKGTYWLTYFRLDGTQLDELNRLCRLDENVLRTLFLTVEPRLVDALVAHAQGGDAAKKSADETPLQQTSEAAASEAAASEAAAPDAAASEAVAPEAAAE